jgi:hypothetical protein
VSIQVAWATREQTLIHAAFHGDWDWYAFYAAAGEIARFMVTVQFPVDVILDLRDSPPVSPDFVNRARFASFYRRNVGTVVIVQAHSAIWPLIKTLQSSRNNPEGPGETLVASTLDEAHRLIQQRRLKRENDSLPRRAKRIGFLWA